MSSCQDMGHQNRGNRDPFMVLALHQGKTLRGSLFPLFPLRVKCQNHEGPYFPYFPYFGGPCLDRMNRHWPPKPFHGFGTSSRENTERVPISPISPKGEVPKTMRGSLFPVFPLFWWSMPWQDEKKGPENSGNRGNRDPLMVLAFHP